MQVILLRSQAQGDFSQFLPRNAQVQPIAEAWLLLGFGTPYLNPEHLTWWLLESMPLPCFEGLFSVRLNMLLNVSLNLFEKVNAKQNAFESTVPFIVCNGTWLWQKWQSRSKHLKSFILVKENHSDEALYKWTFCIYHKCIWLYFSLSYHHLSLWNIKLNKVLN